MDYYLYTGIYLDNAEDFGSKHTSLQMLDLYCLSLVFKTHGRHKAYYMTNLTINLASQNMHGCLYWL
jgi:hypothetical protein